jgi:hypothetical protein
MPFLNKFSKKVQIPNFMQNRPVGAELFHADGQKDERNDEANSCFSQLLELA